MKVNCKCGSPCDSYGDGTECDGQVVALMGNDLCPRHRCEAHCRTLGMTIEMRIAPEPENDE